MCGPGKTGEAAQETGLATPVDAPVAASTGVPPPPIKDVANIKRKAAKRRAASGGTLLTDDGLNAPGTLLTN